MSGNGANKTGAKISLLKVQDFNSKIFIVSMWLCLSLFPLCCVSVNFIDVIHWQFTYHWALTSRVWLRSLLCIRVYSRSFPRGDNMSSTYFSYTLNSSSYKNKFNTLETPLPENLNRKHETFSYDFCPASKEF